MVNRTKQLLKEWKKIFTNPTTDSRLIAKICSKGEETRHQTPSQSNFKMRYRPEQRILSRTSSNGAKTLKEMLNILNHQGNAYANNSEIQSLHSSEWLRSKTPMTANAGDDVEEGEHSSIVGGCANLYSLCGNLYGDLRNYKSNRPVVAHIPVVPALERKRQVDLSEFKNRLAYRVKPCLRKILGINRPQDHAIPLMCTYPKEAPLHHKHICSTMFIETLFIITELGSN